MILSPIVAFLASSHNRTGSMLGSVKQKDMVKGILWGNMRSVGASTYTPTPGPNEVIWFAILGLGARFPRVFLLVLFTAVKPSTWCLWSLRWTWVLCLASLMSPALQQSYLMNKSWNWSVFTRRHLKSSCMLETRPFNLSLRRGMPYCVKGNVLFLFTSIVFRQSVGSHLAVPQSITIPVISSSHRVL